MFEEIAGLSFEEVRERLRSLYTPEELEARRFLLGKLEEERRILERYMELKEDILFDI